MFNVITMFISHIRLFDTYASSFVALANLASVALIIGYNLCASLVADKLSPFKVKLLPRTT